MAKTPEHFIQPTVKDTSKKTQSFSINTGKIAKWVLISGVLVAITGLVAYQTYSFGSKLVRASEAMKFAYQYPELVEPVAEQYNQEWNSLKDSMVKRQAMTGEFDELKKE